MYLIKRVKPFAAAERFSENKHIHCGHWATAKAVQTSSVRCWMFHYPIVIPLPWLETRRSMGPGFKATSFEMKIKLAASIILKKHRACVSFYSGRHLEKLFRAGFQTACIRIYHCLVRIFSNHQGLKIFVTRQILFDSCTASRYDKRYIYKGYFKWSAPGKTSKPLENKALLGLFFNSLYWRSSWEMSIYC